MFSFLIKKSLICHQLFWISVSIANVSRLRENREKLLSPSCACVVHVSAIMDISSYFEDVRRMNKRQVKYSFNHDVLAVSLESNVFTTIGLRFVSAAFLSSIKLCDDSLLRPYDLERSDGCNWKWKPYRSCFKVKINFYFKIGLLL